MKSEYCMEIDRLIIIKKFEDERENFVLNRFIDFKPVKRVEDRSSISESGGPDKQHKRASSGSVGVDVVGTLGVAVQRITLVKFGVYSGSCI